MRRRQSLRLGVGQGRADSTTFELHVLDRFGVEEEESSLPALDSCEIISTAEELQKLDEDIPENEKTTE